MPQATYVHGGCAVDYTPGTAVAAGDVVVQGDLVGVVKRPIAAKRSAATISRSRTRPVRRTVAALESTRVSMKPPRKPASPGSMAASTFARRSWMALRRGGASAAISTA